MTETPELSIVVGTLDRLDQLRTCIESIGCETRTPHVVYVTDAGSVDGTVEYLKGSADTRIRPVLVGRRLGQARAYNDVFDQVSTPYVCWISDDNVIVDGGLDRAVEALRRDRRIGMYALKVQDKLGPFVDAPYIGGFSTLGILNVNQGVLPTEVLKQVGGFSEAFRDYGIDPDLTAKVLFTGRDVVYGRAVAIHHYRNWSVDKTSEAYQALQQKQKRGLALYEAKYNRLQKHDPIFEWKKRVWTRLQALLPGHLAPNGRERFLGLLPRDWKNTWNGRFISVLDPLLTLGRPFHLRQRLPARMSRTGCPPDPEETARPV
jgi:GT2 family glycosyltransferase